jgi:hypothetical protein
VRRALAITGAAIVMATMAAGFAVLGSPAEERGRRLDGRRVADLRSIAAGVNLFFTRRGRLPASLDELGELGPGPSRADPATGEPYEYRVLGTRSYEVCATFAHGGARSRAEDFWAHRAGRQCFAPEVEIVRP